jgi:hypothetical protein
MIAGVDPSKTAYAAAEREVGTGGQAGELFGLLLGGAIGSDSRDDLWQSNAQEQGQEQRNTASDETGQDEYNDERSGIMQSGVYADSSSDLSEYDELLSGERGGLDEQRRDDDAFRTRLRDEGARREAEHDEVTAQELKQQDGDESGKAEKAQEGEQSKESGDEKGQEQSDTAGEDENMQDEGGEGAEEATAQVGSGGQDGQEEGQGAARGVEEGDAQAAETVKNPSAEGAAEEVEESEETEEVDGEGDEAEADAEGELEEGLTEEQMQQQQQAQSQAALNATQQAEIAGEQKRTFSAEISSIAELANRAAEQAESMHAVSGGVLNALGRGEAMTRMEHIQQLSDRFDQHVLSMLRSAADTMTITIVPERLGKLVVSCREQDDGIEVHVRADDPSVCNLLHQQENGIRNILDQNGFKLSEYEVSTGSSETEQQNKGRQTDEKQETGEQQRQRAAGKGRETDADEGDAQSAPAQRISKDGVWLVA